MDSLEKIAEILSYCAGRKIIIEEFQPADKKQKGIKIYPEEGDPNNTFITTYTKGTAIERLQYCAMTEFGLIFQVKEKDEKND